MALNRTDFLKNTVPGQTAQTDATRVLSPALWAQCPRDSYLEDPTLGFFDFDDFRNLMPAPFATGAALTTQGGFGGKYKAYGDTGNTIKKVISNTGGAANATQLVPGGYLEILIDSDNDECSISDAFPSVLITGSTTNSARVWFEACYLQNGGPSSGQGSVQGDAIPATNAANMFLGFAEVDTITLSSSVPFADDATISSTGSYLGYTINEVGSGAVKTVYNDRATSFTSVSATEPGSVTTYVPKKLGLLYDPTNSAKAVRFFVNNVELATGISAATLVATTNLKANGLGRLLSFSSGGATAFRGGLKWWAYAVEWLPNL